MDTLTHALAGAALSDAFFRQRLGRWATPFSLAVAALPDIDVVAYFFSAETAWAHHRGYTHAFFIMILAAPILGAAGWLLGRRDERARDGAKWGWWTLLALVCLVIAHTPLDLATSWGTMPLLPFSNARLSWDLVPILDIFMTSVLLASFVANRLLRWERVDTFLNPIAFPVVHEHPRRRRAADWTALVAVVLVAAYLFIGFLQNRQTVRIARKALADAGIEAVEVRALPIMFTYIAWGVAARDADGNVYNAFYSSYAPKPMVFDRHPTARSNAVSRALAGRDGALFRWYTQGMFVAEEELAADGAVTVRLSDRRFFTMSERGRPRFVVEFREDYPGGPFSAAPRQMGFGNVDIRRELELLWDLTWTGEDGAARPPAP